MSKWLSGVKLFVLSNQLFSWLLQHNENFSDISPLTYNKLSMLPPPYFHFVYFAFSLSNFAFRPTLVYHHGLRHHVGHVQATGPDHGRARAGEREEFSYF